MMQPRRATRKMAIPGNEYARLPGHGSPLRKDASSSGTRAPCYQIDATSGIHLMPTASTMPASFVQRAARKMKPLSG